MFQASNKKQLIGHLRRWGNVQRDISFTVKGKQERQYHRGVADTYFLLIQFIEDNTLEIKFKDGD